jgi:hypothetical protein
LPFGSISVIPTRDVPPCQESNATSLSVPLGIVNVTWRMRRAAPNWSTNVGLPVFRLTDPVWFETCVVIVRAWAWTIWLMGPRLVTLTDLVADDPAGPEIVSWFGVTSRWAPFAPDGALPRAWAACTAASVLSSPAPSSTLGSPRSVAVLVISWRTSSGDGLLPPCVAR